MDDLLETVAPCLDVDIVEIRSDDDMRSLPRRVHSSEEPAMRVWIYSEGALDPTARLYGSSNTRLTSNNDTDAVHGRLNLAWRRPPPQASTCSMSRPGCFPDNGTLGPPGAGDVMQWGCDPEDALKRAPARAVPDLIASLRAAAARLR